MIKPASALPVRTASKISSNGTTMHSNPSEKSRSREIGARHLAGNGERFSEKPVFLAGPRPPRREVPRVPAATNRGP